MKKAVQFIKTSCTYTVLMLVILYLFSEIMQFDNNGIEFPRFALLLLFGIIISLGDYLFKIKALGRAWQILLHYCLLLFAFITIFTLNGMLGKATDFLTSFFVFTFLYLIGFGIAVLSRYIVAKLEKRIPKKGTAATKKSTYTPRFNELDK